MTALRESTRGPLSREQIAAYADVVGDHNPIHLDDAAAQRAGLPSVIAHGPLTVALAIDAVVEQLGAGGLRSARARLQAPVFPGDVLTVAPTDTGVELRKADGSVAAAIVLERVG